MKVSNFGQNTGLVSNASSVAAGGITEPGGFTGMDAILAGSTGQDIADALLGASAPDAGNVFATMADVGALGFVAALVTNSAAQTRNDAALTFDTEVSDPNGYFTGGAPSRFTVPGGQSGLFRLSGGGYAQTGAYRYAIYKNGSNVRSGHTATTDYGEINFVLPLVATDYVELFGIAGANRDYGHATFVDAQSWFSIERIGS